MISHGLYMLKTLKSLSKPIEDSKVLKATWGLKPFKAPSLDGLHPVFFQKCWDVLGQSTLNFVRKVFQDQMLPQGINERLIYLIPKGTNPEIIGQFLPISLCNTSYKLVRKILVNWIRPFIDDLVSPC